MNALGNCFDFLVVLGRALLHDLAVCAVGKRVWHNLVLQFVLGRLAGFCWLDLHTGQFKWCPSIFWWVSQLVVLDHAQDFARVDAQLFGSSVDDRLLAITDACHFAGGALTALGH